MKRLVILALVIPALARADGDPPEPTGVDPIALYPAGLDPVTLCRVGQTCAADLAAAAPPSSLHVAVSALDALLSYSGNPERASGDEFALRVDLWDDARWSAKLGYTLDLIESGSGTTAYHDFMFGGRVTLPTARPAWLLVTGHVFAGDMVSDDGAALDAALGTAFGRFELQLGVGGTILDGDRAGRANVRMTRRGDWLDAWLELDGEAVNVSGVSATHASAAGGLAVHAGRLHLAVSLRAGDRTLAVTDDGDLAEPLLDTFHETGRALVSVDLSDHVKPYLGVSASTATTPAGADYSIVAGFIGLALSF